ncbi:MAG: helix-turn-helix domain-containing protein [Pseudomonadota bacterium]
MSESVAPETTAEDGITAGALLRHAREAAGLHVATLAVSLKVPVRKLEALEEDRYEELPDAVFARALASSVCRTLKIDPQPVLERLPQGRARLRAGEGINAPFRAPGDGPAPGVLDQLTRPVGLTVVALLLGALIIIFLPNLRRDNGEVAPKPEAAAQPDTPSVAPSLPAEPASSVPPPMASELPQAGVPAPAATTPPAPAAAASSAGVPVRAASAPTASTSTTMSTTVAFTPPAEAANALVSFRTRGTSWIQVTDAKGNVVLQRLMNQGESATAGGALPLTVTVGSAGATEVQVRGKPYDLRGMAHDNVARFQVK